MRTIIILLLGVLAACGSGQQAVIPAKPDIPPPPPPVVYNAFINDDGFLVGRAKKEDFMQEAFAEWFFDDYDHYTPDPVVIENLKPLLNDDISIKAFMGTWCGDSRREVPHFYRILNACEYDVKKLEMYGVDRSKVTPNNDQEGLDVFYVPTFIFYKNGIEINRFVEYPQETLEADMLEILKENGYKHPYFEG
jgi:thiol-disulfide isomerase/thioredoxin